MNKEEEKQILKDLGKLSKMSAFRIANRLDREHNIGLIEGFVAGVVSMIIIYFLSFN